MTQSFTSWFEDEPAPLRLVPDQHEKLHWYQQDARDAVLEALKENESTLVVMATGTGKTQVFSGVTEAFDGNVLVLAHRDELVQQARDRLEAFLGEPVEVEQRDLRASHKARVVVGSVQSVTRQNRLDRLGTDRFQLVIQDEAHHARAATFERIYDFFKNAKRAGFTATPDRGDEMALGKVFKNVAYCMDIDEGIDAGYLVPIRGRRVELGEIDISGVKVQGGDLVAGQLDEAMLRATEGIVKAVLEHEPDRQGIGFFPGIKTCQFATDRMNALCPGSAALVVAGTQLEERRQIVADFKAGRLRYLMGVGVPTEGFDAPPASLVIMGRPTKSRSLYSQMCLDSKTEILTNKGWLGINDPRPEDLRIAAFDSVYMNDGIRWQRPLGWVERSLACWETMWGLQSPHLDIRVTNAHKMVVRQRHGRMRERSPWQLQDAELVPDAFEIPINGTEDRAGVPLTDDELRFIGLLMTDGAVGSQKQATLFQSERYPEVIEFIIATLDGCGFKYGHNTTTEPTNFGARKYRAHRWWISFGRPRGAGKHLRGWGALANYYDKTLAEPLMAMTPKQFGVLYEAMWMGDGIKRRHAEHVPRTLDVCTSRKRLADRVQSLAVRSGWRCTVSQAGEQMWMVHARPGKRTWSVLRRASDQRPTWGQVPTGPVERVWCVTVDTGMIVTRRNGKVAIVGNCGRGTRVLPGVLNGYRGREESAQRRAAIASSAKPDMMILDFVGNSGRHSLVGPEDLLGGNYSEAEIAEAKKRESPGGDIRAALERARGELRRIAGEMKSKVVSKVSAFDPFSCFGVDRSKLDAQEARFGYTPASEKQVAMLRRAGLEDDALRGLSKQAASKLVGTMIKRRELGLASYPQLKALRKMGVATPVILTARNAAQTIEYIHGLRGFGPDPSVVEGLLHGDREAGID